MLLELVYKRVRDGLVDMRNMQYTDLMHTLFYSMKLYNEFIGEHPHKSQEKNCVFFKLYLFFDTGEFVQENIVLFILCGLKLLPLLCCLQSLTLQSVHEFATNSLKVKPVC